MLTGASGVGKTSIALAIMDRYPEVRVSLGDRIGPPSAEIMAGYGLADEPAGLVQRGFALDWIGEIAPTLSDHRPVLLETQCRIAFLLEALQRHRVSHARVLVACDDERRDARLIHDRPQPEPANEEMRNWSPFLRPMWKSKFYLRDSVPRPKATRERLASAWRCASFASWHTLFIPLFKGFPLAIDRA